MKKYLCTACDWVYDPALGDPEGGIDPGVPYQLRLTRRPADKAPGTAAAKPRVVGRILLCM
jgi:hypothetical protein